jgi:HlyD family secretion protein
MASSSFRKWKIAGVIVIGVAIAGMFGWFSYRRSEATDEIASGNGRLEATEIDIATKFQGRVADILFHEGDFIEAGQVAARMDTKSLAAQLRQAKAKVAQARHESAYAAAVVAQRKSELDIAQKDYRRSRSAYQLDKGAVAVKRLDHDRATVATAAALLAEAEAKVLGAKAAIDAAMAAAETIAADIDDCILKSPVKGRILYRLAEPGEVLSAGGKVLTVLELTDVYMTIFLPTRLAGRVRIGADARLVFDALPDLTVPAKVSFVAPEAQFSPKEVETRTEREKLMFRIKVKIAPELLLQHLADVKTGVPGVAYVRLDPEAQWPEDIRRRALP